VNRRIGVAVTLNPKYEDAAAMLCKCNVAAAFIHREKPQAKLVEEQSRSVETVEKEPPFAIIRSG